MWIVRQGGGRVIVVDILNSRREGDWRREGEARRRRRGEVKPTSGKGKGENERERDR